jgi:hypothetical protein
MKIILEKSRYLAIIGVISLLIAAVAAFVWGTLKTVSTTLLVQRRRHHGRSDRDRGQLSDSHRHSNLCREPLRIIYWRA